MERVRCMLEVLKFLEAKDILSNTSTVSQHWQRLSSSSEIWSNFCEAEGITENDMVAYAHAPKLAYRELSSLKVRNTVIVAQGQLKLFDCRTRQSVFTRTTRVSETCSAVMIRNDRVFFTGGQDTEQRAFLYDFPKDQIEEYPNTLDRRRYHGSAYFCSRIYLFGGDFQSSKTAEKCSFHHKRWAKLPQMPVKRSAFTPCIQKRCIYLCGGHVSTSHVFHIDRETYKALPFKLPAGLWCVSSFVGDDLILENSQYRSKWNSKEGLTSVDVGRRIIP